MSNVTPFIDELAGFRFTRPSEGRIGRSENLHPSVVKALEALEQKLAQGFSAPDPKLGTTVEEARLARDEAAAKLERLQRVAEQKRDAADQAWEAHRAAEDVAERLADQVNEALRGVGSVDPKGASGETGSTPVAKSKKGQSGASGSGAEDDAIQKLAVRRDEQRREAQQKLETAELASREADSAANEAASASKALDSASFAVDEAIRKWDGANSDLGRVLALPIFSSDPDRTDTLLRYQPVQPTISLREHIDRRGRTQDLYEVRRLLESSRSKLDFNRRNLLSNDAIVEYLFARAAFVGGFDTPRSILSTLTSPTRGAHAVFDYVVERALVDRRDTKLISVSPGALAKMVASVREKSPSLRQESFELELDRVYQQFVYGEDEEAIIAAGEQQLGFSVPSRLRGPLVDYIRRYNARAEDPEQQIDRENAAYFLPTVLAKLSQSDLVLVDSVSEEEVTVADYSVNYYADRTQEVEYDRASIQAAAQMYLTMVWGDELGIFETVNRIAMQSGGSQYRPIRLEVRSRQLSDDLRMYVLDEEFVDLKTGRRNRRVAPAERQMFYRQLFGIGDSRVIDEAQVNPDFERLWAVLMMEVVKYIGKVEENGSSYAAISANKIYQAIEDLQYNLSAYCTGLPKIAAPTIHAELDFVIQRILDSSDVKEQLARRGPRSFWKVVEEVRGMEDFTPLRNKGMYGHMILEKVANATPDLVDDQQQFEQFIGAVESFILAQDQLSEAEPQGPIPTQFPGFFGLDSIPGMPLGAVNGNGAAHAAASPSGPPINGKTNGSSDDWNF